MHHPPWPLSSEGSPPAAKKPRTSSVVVEQSGGSASNKVLIDQVADMETNFDEVGTQGGGGQVGPCGCDGAGCGQNCYMYVGRCLFDGSLFISSQLEEWPFSLFCEEMFQNLFNPAWEVRCLASSSPSQPTLTHPHPQVRHGAATALREIIKLHGKTAGISIFTPPSEVTP